MLNLLQFKIRGRNESGGALGGLKKDLGGVKGMLASVQDRARRTGKSLKKIGKGASLNVTAPLVAGFAGVLKLSGDFEQSMNRVKALSGSTEADFASLQKTAMTLGATTKFSASQAADAMGFLAMAGFDANQIIGAMPSTLQLAAAAGADLATSADIVSNILTGFGKDVSDLANVNDVLVKTMTSANTDLRMLGDAMKYVGPVAASAKLRFNEVSAAIGLLGNAGIQGEMGGTALRGAITRLLNPTKAVSTVIDELGVSFYKSNGQLKDITSILRELEPHAEKTGSIMKLFGQRAGPAMAALLSQGADELVKFEGILNSAGGTAAAIADTQMQGLKGATTELRSALEGLAIAIGNSGILEWATDAAKGLTGFVRNLSETNPELLKMGTIIGGVALAVGPLLFGLGLMVTVMAPLAGLLALVISPLGLLAAAVATAGTAIYANWAYLKEEFPAITGAIGGALNILLSTFNIFKDTAMVVGSYALEQFRLMAVGIEALLSGDFKGALDAGQGILTNWGNALYNVMDTLSSGMLTKGLEIGGHIIDGIRQGIASKWNALKTWFSSLTDQIPQWMRDRLDINSPSRVFAQIGGFIVDGLTQGIQGKSADPKTALQSLSDSFQGIFSGGSGNGPQEWMMQSDQIQQATEKLDGYSAKVDGVKASSNGLFSTIFDGAQGQLSGLLDGSKKVGDVLKSALSSFADNLFDSALSQLSSGLNGMMSTVLSSLGGGGGGGGGFGGFVSGILGSIFPSANGNILSGGRIKAFATGGVVNSPTYFPMRGGTGLMGEAGPEAIMPLTRIGGKLGVRSEGGGGAGVTVNIVNNAPGVTVEQEPMSNGELRATIREEISKYAPGVVAADITKSNSKTSKAIGKSFKAGKVAK